MRQGQVGGFLMQEIPAHFYAPNSRGIMKPRELQYLLYERKPAWGEIVSGDVGVQTRIEVALEFAELVHLLHGRFLVIGDISMINVLWTPGRNSIFLIDCDGVRQLGSAPVLRQVATPDWEDPMEPASGPDLDSDRYKLALLVGRVLSRSPHLHPGEELLLTPDLPVDIALQVRKLWTRAAGPRAGRPNASDWVAALNSGVEISLSRPAASRNSAGQALLVRQDVTAGGDAPVAGRDLSGKSQVVQGGRNIQVQVNVSGHARVEAAPRDLGVFRADLLTLVDRVHEDSVRGGLPERLVPGGDVLRMTQTVRLLGDVRQPPEPDGEMPGIRPSGRKRERAYGLAAEEGHRVAEPPRPWEQVVAAYDRLVVLGDPGMGKSWLLRAQAHRLAEEARQDLAGSADSRGRVLVPVVIRAGVLAKLPGKTLAEAVSRYLVAEGWLPPRSADWMRDQIDAGGVVLLVDALDEVPVRGSGPGSWQRVADLLRRWTESCTGTARCVVTSRLAGYAGPPVPGAREAELLPFEPQDVQRAADAWDLPGQATAQLREWLAQPAVAAMARIPLLLALLCSLAADPIRQQRLIQTRAELYGAVVWQFLSGAHRSGGPGGIGEVVGEAERQTLLAALGRVAFTFAETSRGWIDQLPYRELVEALRGAGDALGTPPEVVLDRLVTRAGMLVPTGSPAVGEQDYLFLHRTMAEYLVARHLAGLPTSDRMRIVVAHQWFEPDWAEVIPMLGALLATRNLPDAQALVTHFLTVKPDPLHRAFDSALRIICEAPDPDRLLTPATSQELHRRLIRLGGSNDRLIRTLTAGPAWPQAITRAILALATGRNAEHRRVAADVLAQRREVEASSTLLDLAADSDKYVRRAAVQALAGREGAEVTSGLLVLATHSDSDVRLAVAQALAGREGAEVTSVLLALAADGDKYVRRAVVQALAGREGAEVTSALLVLATHSDSDVRLAAAQALAGREGAEVTSALLALAADGDKYVRLAAVQALAGREGAEVTSALLALAADGDKYVRLAAVQALVGREAIGGTSGLLSRAIDSDSDIRWAAVQALAGREGAEVTSGLLSRAADSDSDVRLAAAQALAGREGAEVTSALLALATDGDSGMRRAAVQALAGREAVEVTSGLLALATHPDSGVRSAAAQALAGREAVEVTSALLALATDRDSGVRRGAAEALAGREGAEVTSALLSLAADRDSGVRRGAAEALAGREGAEVTSALLALATDSHVRLAAAEALAGREGAEVTSALLSLAADGDKYMRWTAAQALAGRRDPVILGRLCRRWRVYELPALRRERRDLADMVADHLYILLPPAARPRILRRLARLTRLTVPSAGVSAR
jgi:HEAT repeat protein